MSIDLDGVQEDHEMEGAMARSTKGEMDRVKGNVKSGVGKATNNKSLSMKGRAQQTKGSAKQAAKKAKDAVTR
jgi:uncharacterized protein YjbJ (UPF0337 family)